MSGKSRRRGTIEKRGGAWLVRVTIGRDPVTGKQARVSRMVLGSRTDAQRVLTEVLGKRDRGAPLPTSRITLGAWLEEYVNTWSGGLGPQTRVNAEQALRCYVSPALRAVRLGALRAQHFQELYNTLEARGLAPATISNLHRILKTRLGKAVELGHLGRQPLIGAAPPAARRREYRVLNPAEARVFLQEVEGNPHAALWTLLLLTGLRPAEALGLKWADLDGSRLAVRRSLVWLPKGVWTLAETKTRRGRTVALAETAVRALTRHRASQNEARLKLGGEYARHGLIFATTFGGPLRWENLVTRHFDPILAKTAVRLQGLTLPSAPEAAAGAPETRAWGDRVRAVSQEALRASGLQLMRPYDLRHSAATLLLAAGEHPKVVAELLGHSKVTLTLDTYSHVLPGLLEQAAQRMEELVSDERNVVSQSSK